MRDEMTDVKKIGGTPSPWRLLGVMGLVVLLPALAPPPMRAQSDHGFRFIRIRYEDPRGNARRFGGPGWSHDYPTAEQNFYEALNRTTQIHVEGPPLILSLDDPRIFEYPVLYLSEPGFWTMADQDVENLRRYLDRGGFILFDDFRNQHEWIQLYEQMKRVYPDREFREIAPDHPIWNLYYDIDPVEAPSLVSGCFCAKYDDQYMALFDDHGRMVALAGYNQDIGDGWEWPDRNFEEASTISFQMGINFVMYALTH